MQRKNKSFNFNKKIIVLLACFIASCALWVYVTYVEDPSLSHWKKGIPLEISGQTRLLENNLSISDISVEKMDVKLSAPRSRFKYLTSDSVTASVDVSKITAPGTYTLDISLTCSSDYTIVDRKRTTAIVEVEEYVKDKFFSVDLIYNKKPENGYSVKDANIDGNDITVSVSGPISKVERVKKVVIDNIDLSKVKSDTTLELECIPLDEEDKKVEGVILSTTTARVNFIIYKTATLPIELSIYEGGDNPRLDYTLSVETVGVTGPAADMDAIDSILTQTINEYNYRAGKDATLKLVLPQNIALCEGASDSVTVTFKKAE